MKGFEGHLTPPVSNTLLGHLSPNLFAVMASISFQQMATKWGNFPRPNSSWQFIIFRRFRVEIKP